MRSHGRPWRGARPFATTTRGHEAGSRSHAGGSQASLVLARGFGTTAPCVPRGTAPASMEQGRLRTSACFRKPFPMVVDRVPNTVSWICRRPEQGGGKSEPLRGTWQRYLADGHAQARADTTMARCRRVMSRNHAQGIVCPDRMAQSLFRNPRKLRSRNGFGPRW